MRKEPGDRPEGWDCEFLNDQQATSCNKCAPNYLVASTTNILHETCL